MRYDDDFKLFVGALSFKYVDTTMTQSIFDKTLTTLHDRAKKNVMDDLRSFREECLAVGYSGAFLGAQLDLTITAAGEEYITFTVSYVRKGSSDVTRVKLATQAFPGTHTAEDIRPWLETVRRFCCFTVYLLFDFFNFQMYCFWLTRFLFVWLIVSPFLLGCIVASNFMFILNMYIYIYIMYIYILCLSRLVEPLHVPGSC